MKYTIGIQFLGLFFRKFQVIDHDLSDDGRSVMLHGIDGSIVSVPGMDRKAMKLYPDYRIYLEQKRRLQPSPPRPQVEDEQPWPDLKN